MNSYAVIVTPDTEELLVGLAHKAGYKWCSGDHYVKINNWYSPTYLILENKSISWGDNGSLSGRTIKTLDEIIEILSPSDLTWDDLVERELYEVTSNSTKGTILIKEKVNREDRAFIIKGVGCIIDRGLWSGTYYMAQSFKKAGKVTL